MKALAAVVTIASLASAGSVLAAAPERTAEAKPVASSSCPPGFAPLQQSGTCVRVSGRVRADVVASSTGGRAANTLETQTTGRVQLDVRKQTELGPFRAVIRAEGARR